MRVAGRIWIHKKIRQLLGDFVGMLYVGRERDPSQSPALLLFIFDRSRELCMYDVRILMPVVDANPHL
jgi:hypothetical protein